MLHMESSFPNKSQISKVLGKEIRHGVRGSTTYFVTFFRYNTENIDLDWLAGAKGIFQLFEKGILLRLFKSNKANAIPIPHQQFIRIEVEKGREIIEPALLSPFWILLKLGVRTEIARYFKLYPREYAITPTRLMIVTSDFELRLETNGHTYQSQKDFFLAFSKRYNLELLINE